MNEDIVRKFCDSYLNSTVHLCMNFQKNWTNWLVTNGLRSFAISNSSDFLFKLPVLSLTHFLLKVCDMGEDWAGFQSREKGKVLELGQTSDQLNPIRPARRAKDRAEDFLKSQCHEIIQLQSFS